jgi:hypothetical protein
VKRRQLDGHLEALATHVAAQPDATLAELVDWVVSSLFRTFQNYFRHSGYVRSARICSTHTPPTASASSPGRSRGQTLTGRTLSLNERLQGHSVDRHGSLSWLR